MTFFYLTSAAQSKRPIGFNFAHGPVTTYGGSNPTFYAIDFDEEYMVPLNIHSYSFKLDEANKLDTNQKSAAHLWEK